MTTFPARLDTLQSSLDTIVRQVDRVNLVLNEYSEVPKFLSNYASVNPIIPETDLKDTGKFYPETAPSDYVFLVDDDILYSSNYVSLLRERFDECTDKNIVVGLHGTIYRIPTKSLRDRQRLDFRASLRSNTYVDQLGTGTVLTRGRNMPDFDAMKTSQRFVDVRFASWCFKNDISLMAVARKRGTAKQIKIKSASIYGSFTRNSPENVLAEAQEFAGLNPKVKSRGGIRRALEFLNS